MKALTALMIALFTAAGIGIPTRPGTHPNPHTPPTIPHVRHK